MSTLSALSTQFADLADATARVVVQVASGRRPVSGVVHGPDTIVTTAGAIGRDAVRVRLTDGTVVDGDVAGWDPGSRIAVIRTRERLNVEPLALSAAEARAGQIVLAVARSWSNALTVSAGNVAVVGGPLRTGRRRQLERVIRVTAPMHEGFAGGALVDADGRLAGITTAASIRGYGVVIPASIAWASAAQILAHGSPKRGFIGVAVQPAALASSQQTDGRERGLVVIGVTPGSPADTAGVLTGDIVLDAGGRPTTSPEDLLDAIDAQGIGAAVRLRVSRGGTVLELEVTVAERP